MEQKVKLTKLAEYYIDRYDIETYDNDSVSTTLRQQIKRLLNQVQIGETTLYEAINQNGKAREISVEEFEKYCFSDWAMFLVGKVKRGGGYVDHDNEAFVADLEKNKIDLEWIEKAKIANEEISKAMERYFDSGEQEYDNKAPAVAEAELKEKGYSMILEAIYSMFFEPFKWDKLESDMEWKLTLDTGYNAQNPPEVFKACEELEDIKNYCTPNINSEFIDKVLDKISDKVSDKLADKIIERLNKASAG